LEFLLGAKLRKGGGKEILSLEKIKRKIILISNIILKSCVNKLFLYPTHLRKNILRSITLCFAPLALCLVGLCFPMALP